jgi:hypothetical protein
MISVGGTNKGAWRQSKARELLMKDLRDGSISLDGSTSVCEIVSMRIEYGECDAKSLKIFAARLYRARKSVRDSKYRAAVDKLMIEQCIKICQQQKSAAGMNVPIWVRSKASMFLKDDIKNGIHFIMKPIEMYNSRDEYKEFPLPCFRGHIYQEIRTEKFRNQCKNRSRRTPRLY